MRIGIFDSGIGGLTVLSELRKRFSSTELVYLGDTANLPYGTKSPQHVEQLSCDGARKLLQYEIDALVVACNTASSLALPAIQSVTGKVPVFGVVKPGAQAALAALEPISQPGPEPLTELTLPILVLATRATVRSQAYGKTLRELVSPDLPGKLPLPIIEQACPLLVPMIEEGWIDHPILHQTIREYVSAHAATHVRGVVLLGCTHYPWIQSAIAQALPGWTVVDSAHAIAKELEGDFEKLGLFESGAGKRSGAPIPSKPIEWIFTDPLAVPTFARQWMGTLSK